jgi:hypothetical protein
LLWRGISKPPTCWSQESDWAAERVKGAVAADSNSTLAGLMHGKANGVELVVPKPSNGTVSEIKNVLDPELLTGQTPHWAM